MPPLCAPPLVGQSPMAGEYGFPRTRWRQTGTTEMPPTARFRRSSFNTKSIYLHTQRWESHPAASVWINSVESDGRSAPVQRGKLACSGVGVPSFLLLPRNCPRSRVREGPPRAARSLSGPKRERLPFGSSFLLGGEGWRFGLQGPSLHAHPQNCP